jgi:hypothetical protein
MCADRIAGRQMITNKKIKDFIHDRIRVRKMICTASASSPVCDLPQCAQYADYYSLFFKQRESLIPRISDDYHC